MLESIRLLLAFLGLVVPTLFWSAFFSFLPVLDFELGFAAASLFALAGFCFSSFLAD